MILLNDPSLFFTRHTQNMISGKNVAPIAGRIPITITIRKKNAQPVASSLPLPLKILFERYKIQNIGTTTGRAVRANPRMVAIAYFEVFVLSILIWFVFSM